MEEMGHVWADHSQNTAAAAAAGAGLVDGMHHENQRVTGSFIAHCTGALNLCLRRLTLQSRLGGEVRPWASP